MKEDQQSSNKCEQTTNHEICLQKFQCEDWFFYCMIAAIILITIIVGFGMFLLIRQRNKYPIRERSCTISTYMLYCFYCLVIYYPTAYIHIYYQQDIHIIQKWVYMQALFGLYLSYFARSLRIYSAFTNCVTEYFQNDQPSQFLFNQSNTINEQSKKIEWLITILIAVISILLCTPLIFNKEIYLIPIENYEQTFYGIKGDYLASFIYSIITLAFILQIHILRNVPKHYRFHKESRWNLITQWTKTITICIFNFSYDKDWCTYSSPINISFNYIQYLSMIFISIVPALWRSQYIATPPPFPQLFDFEEFIEDEGDHNNIYCNKSFIAFLKKKDTDQMKKNESQLIEVSHDNRINLNIYEFYFKIKTIKLQDESQQQQKLNDYIKTANFNIFTTQKKYLIKLPDNFDNTIEQFKRDYQKYQEFNQNISNLRDKSQPRLRNQNDAIQSKFIDDIEFIYDQCSKYLKDRVFQEYIQTEQFNHIKEYYDQQNLYQTNLQLLQLFHLN